MRTNTGFEVENLGSVNPGATANQVLWSVNPPVKYKVFPKVKGYDMVTRAADFVVTSAVVAWDTGCPETYIFPADRTGEVLAWGELPGSFRGTLDHESAIMSLNHGEEW